jgi:iron complex outermembrane receptor protein
LPASTAGASYNLSDTAKSFGVVIKPIKEVSFFYGYNTTGGTMPGTLSAGNNPDSLKVASGNQKEFGVKTSLLDGRFTASISHFDIVQQNYAVPNSEYYNLVAQGRQAEANALQNPLYLNLNSKGWEGEMTYSISKNLTVLANYTDFKVRQPITNVRVRGVPDKAGGVYLDYRFTDGFAKGFGVNFGADYKSDVAGDNATGYTTTAPITGVGFVANQPSFYVAGRTLANVGVSYRRDHYTVRFTVTNVFDKDYILAAGSRTSVIEGEPIAFKSSFTYKF